MRGNRRCRELLLAWVGAAVILLLIGCDGGGREGGGVAPAAGQLEPAGKPEQAPPATAGPTAPVAVAPPAESPAPAPAVAPAESPSRRSRRHRLIMFAFWRRWTRPGRRA